MIVYIHTSRVRLVSHELAIAVAAVIDKGHGHNRLYFSADVTSSGYDRAFADFCYTIMKDVVTEKKPRTLTWLMNRFQPLAAKEGLAPLNLRYVSV